MHYISVDCGTSTSRAYVVDDAGRVLAKATRGVGVRDTATSGSKETLRNGLRDIVAEAQANAGLTAKDAAAILSSGMITSEIGLHDIPHLIAPVGMKELAEGMTRVEDAGIAAPEIPVYFVRGVKNRAEQGSRTAAAAVGDFDFMRGEETQMAGLLDSGRTSPPTVAVVLSSHTKFIPLSPEGKILGSVTTLSGQLFDAVVNHTFVSKSCRRQPGEPEKPENYYDAALVEKAQEWISRSGLVRSLMFPRFLDVLLDTAWYERELFLDALIASEDMLALDQVASLTGGEVYRHFVLIGPAGRCRLYRDILSRRLPEARIDAISEDADIDALAIQGSLMLARRAGVIA